MQSNFDLSSQLHALCPLFANAARAVAIADHAVANSPAAAAAAAHDAVCVLPLLLREMRNLHAAWGNETEEAIAL